MAERWVCLNGDLVSEHEAVVPALGGGIAYGYGVFETMRAYGGRAFQLEAHYERLVAGARFLGLHVPFDAAGLDASLRALLQRNGLSDASMRLTLEGDPPPDEGAAPTARWFASAQPATQYPEALYERGASAIVSSVRRNETSPLSRLKTLNYLDNLLARREARRLGADEAILLNTRGEVAEGSASNIFIVRSGEMVTPPVEAGALPGIARAVVLELASSLGVVVREATFALGALRAADEAFLTNSLMEVLPLTRLDGVVIGGQSSDIAMPLRQHYRALAAAST